VFVAVAFQGLITMAIKERPTIVHCRLDDGVGGTAVMGAKL
jgi:hypothetical protein